MNQVNPAACPRGTNVTFSTGSWFDSKVPVIACPTSWYATRRLLRLSRRHVPSNPVIIRSIAVLTSTAPIFSFFPRAAKIAASFRTLAKSAPANPTVRCARFLIETC